MSFIFLLMTFTLFVDAPLYSPGLVCLSLTLSLACHPVLRMALRKIAHRSITMCVQVSTNVIHPFIHSWGCHQPNTIQSNNYLAWHPIVRAEDDPPARLTHLFRAIGDGWRGRTHSSRRQKKGPCGFVDSVPGTWYCSLSKIGAKIDWTERQ